MKEAKKNEVAVQQDELTTRTLALKADAQERAQALQELGVDSKDIVIPSIQVMQNTSALVGEEKAKLGEIVNMATEEILGGGDTKVQLLPLKIFKTLRIYVVNPGFKFLREEPLTALNEKLPPEGTEPDGTPVKRYQTINAFVLLKTDLAKGEGFPSLIRFKSTGMNAGRGLATHLYKLVYFKKRPYAQFVELSTRKEKKDTNTYAVPIISTKGSLAASPAEVEAAEGWLAMLAAGNYKVDEREDIPEEQTEKTLTPTVVKAEVVEALAGEY